MFSFVSTAPHHSNAWYKEEEERGGGRAGGKEGERGKGAKEKPKPTLEGRICLRLSAGPWTTAMRGSLFYSL